jgi:polar amino acid transport system substrate-binding protein
VRLRLVWKNQFQFAGYYMAKEKGFYQQEGIDIEILEKDPAIDNVEEVASGKVDFAVGRSSMLIKRAQGVDIVALMATFQHSPMMLLALKDTGITSPVDLRGKRIMFASDGKYASEIMAMLMRFGLTENDYVYLPHSFNVGDLVSGKTDAMVAYVSNEPYHLQVNGIKHHMIHPKDYGFKMYSDILFTSGTTIKNNKDLVNRFYRATMRGWLYAFENIHEAADVIYKKYNTQNLSKGALVYEGEVLKQHAFDKYGGFGAITIPRLKQMIQVYLLANLLHKDVSLNGFIYQPSLSRYYLSLKELDYISSKESISVCVRRDWMPYEDYVDGKHKGIVADYLRLLQKKIGVPFVQIPTNSIQHAWELVKTGECELISNVIPTAWGSGPGGYSISYLNIPLSIASNKGLQGVNAIPESIAVTKETALEEIIRVRHPDISVIPVENSVEGLNLVKRGDVKGLLCTDAHISSVMSEKNIKDIVIDDFAEEDIGISVAVAKDNELLLRLVNKAIRSITYSERHDIANNWINVEPKPTISPDIIWKLLIGIGLVVVLAVYINWFVVRRNKQLSKIAGTDWLTQLPNRHSLIRKIEGFIHHSNRYSRTVSLIYFDIDNFKAINDRFGHNIGDEVLKKMARLINSVTRVTDACGRWGGEEFILVSLESGIYESQKVAEKLRQKIEVHDFGIPVNITCSFGVAQYENEEPLEHFVHRADMALYEAKNTGRNRVVVYESGEE